MAHSSPSPFTQHPEMSPTVIFPNSDLQILSTFLNLIGISVVAYCFSRRTMYENLLTRHGWISISWPRLCVILVFASSWAFVFSGMAAFVSVHFIVLIAVPV